MTRDFSEDKLVQETTANYFRDKLGWDSVPAKPPDRRRSRKPAGKYAYNDEILGVEGTLGRA